MRIGGSVMKPYHNPEEWLACIREMTASAVIFPVQSNEPVSLQEEYLACIQENRLVIGEVGVWRNVLDQNPDKRKENIDYAIAQLALAEKIGANCCVNISGSYGSSLWDGYHPNNYSKAGYEMIISVTREIIDAVQPVRTKFCLESMPWMLPDSPESYLQLIQDIDRPGFGVHMDYTNMINSLDRYHNADVFISDCFRKLGDRICSVHAKDVQIIEGALPLQLQEVIPGHGRLDLENIVRCCEALGPDIPVFTEHLSTHEEYMEAILNLRSAAQHAGVTVQ